MKSTLSVAILILTIFASGCTYISETKTQSPSDTLELFQTAFDNNEYNVSYELISSDYKEKYTYDDFVNEIRNTNRGLFIYNYQVVGDTKNIQNNTASLEIEYTISSKENSWLMDQYHNFIIIGKQLVKK